MLALDISHDMQYAVSCGSDNVLARYNLTGQLQGVPEVTQIALKANGIADIKIRSDNKIIGLAGWDGRYSTLWLLANCSMRQYSFSLS